MDSRTVSCYFIGYPERSKGYKFYDPTIRTIFEMGNAQFFEDVEFDGGDKDRDFVFEEEYCKTWENSNFLKKGKITILVKIQNFSRSRMTKRTSSLESSREI